MPGGRIFYGWAVVGGAFVVLFLGFGNAYTFTTYFTSLQAEFGADRAAVSLAFSIAGFLYFSLGAVSGPVAARWGTRPTVAGGIALVGLAMIAAGLADSLTQVYLAYGLGVGIGVGFAYVPAIGAVQRWFVARRGAASGYAVAGIGLGTLCMPPLTTLAIELMDWRLSYITFGAVTLVLGVAAALLLVDSPDRRGLMPDGAANGGTGQPVTETDSVPIGRAIRSRPFWVLYIATALVSVGLFIPFVHIVPFAGDRGLGAGSGVLLLGLIGVGSTAGRFLLGGVADRMGRRRSLAAMYVGMAVMFAWWYVAESLTGMIAFSLVFGACYGGFVALAPAVIADYFGGRYIGVMLGALYTSVAFGNLIGPWAAGLAFDLYQSYSFPIAASAACALIGAACTGLLPDPARWRTRAVAGLKSGAVA